MLVFRRDFWHVSAYWSFIAKMHPLSEPEQVRETFDLKNISPFGKFPDKSCPALRCTLVIFQEYTERSFLMLWTMSSNLCKFFWSDLYILLDKVGFLSCCYFSTGWLWPPSQRLASCSPRGSWAASLLDFDKTKTFWPRHIGACLVRAWRGRLRDGITRFKQMNKF